MKTKVVNIKDRTGLYWLWISIAVVIADQITKYFILKSLEFDQPLYLFPFLNFILEHNKGAAFSLMHQFGNTAVWLFIGTATVVSIIICIWLSRLPATHRWLGISLSLILGGAIGNLIDRIQFGYVVDFIHFHVLNWNFAVFNVADAAISIGAIMLIIDIFRKKE